MNKRLRSSAASTAVDHRDLQENGDGDEEEQALIPGLPDHIAHLCLSRLPPSLLSSVSSTWRRLLYSPFFPPLLSLYALLSPTSAVDSSVTPIQFMTYDPIAGAGWLPIPPPPPPPLRLLLRHPSFISRSLSVQSLSVSGNLVLLAATGECGGGGEIIYSHDPPSVLVPYKGELLPALPHPLVFSPLSGSWSHGPSLPAPRRWCAAGTLSGSVFVASGIGSHFTDDVARSFEKWNFAGAGEGWERLGRMKDGRFSREAIDAVGCKGKLWMVNVKGSGAKQGAVYDVVGGGEWEEMPEAMIRGWMGPAAAMEEEEMYLVDEAKGALIRWDWEEGKWVEVAESPMLRGAQQIAAARGKVCAVVEGVGGVVVVDVKAVPARVWVIETPPGYEAITVHVLPRMCCRPSKKRPQ